MPGNEVDNRVHNFFQQINLSQSQNHTQSVDGNWTVFNNNLWAGNERQIGGAFNRKHFNVQQSDSDRGTSNQFLVGPYGLNPTQSSFRSESAKGLSQNQQSSLNGFMHASQVSRAREKEANILGMETESDQHNPMLRGLPILESQHTSGPQYSNSSSVKFATTEAPLNFDFLGSQQQMNNQQPGTLQALPRQQSGIGDVPLLQQQVMLKQMQELQKGQQCQQIEATQRNSGNQMSIFQNQAVGKHSVGFLNGTPMNDGPNYTWSSQVMEGNTNWLQHGISAGVQGSPNRAMITPEQAQELRLMGLMPQQASQSLFGVPVSNTQAANSFLHAHLDQPGMHQVPVHSSSLPGNQHALFSEQVSVREGNTIPRPDFENKCSFQHGFDHYSNELVNIENFNQLQQRNSALSELGGRQDVIGSSESLPEKMEKHVASSQTAVSLDPTEEKILFGSDDNIWEAFGGSLTTDNLCYNHLDGAFPSVQSGSWSALMLSAAAESSTDDIGMQGEWSGMDVQNSGSLMGNQQHSVFHDSGKQQAAWVDGSKPALVGNRPFHNDAHLSCNYHTSGIQQSFINQPRESLQTRSSQQSSEEGRKWSDRSQPQTPAEGSQVPEKAYSSVDFNSRGITGSCSNQQSISLHHSQPCSTPSALNFIESVPQNVSSISKSRDNLLNGDCSRDLNVNIGYVGAMSRHGSVPNSNVEMEPPKFNSKDEPTVRNSTNIKVNQEPSKKPSENQRNFWKTVGSSVKSGMDDLRKYQLQLNKGPEVLDVSVNNTDKGAVEMHEASNADKREISSDSRGSNLSHHDPSVSLRGNVLRNAIDTQSFPGGKQKLSGQGGRKSMFQYHPMEDLDMGVEPDYGTKHVMQSQAKNQHPLFIGLRSHDEPSVFLNANINSSTDSEKLQGCEPDIHGHTKVPYGVSSTGIHPGDVAGASAFLDGTGGVSASDKTTPSSENMLELLHKVDQSKEQSSIGQFSFNRSSGMCEPESSDGTIGLCSKRPSASESFGLQLAPPSEGFFAPNFMVASQTSSQNVSSPGSNNVASNKGHKAAWLASAASVQCLTSLHERNQRELEKNKSGIPWQADSDTVQGDMQGNLPMHLAPGSVYLRSLLQNQHMTDAGGKMISDQPGHISIDKVSHGKHNNDSQDLAHSTQVSVSSASGSILHNNLASQREISQLCMNQSDARVSIYQSQLMDVSTTSQPSLIHGMSQRCNLPTMVPGLLTNITTQQPMLGAQSHNVSDLLKSQFQSNSFMEARSCTHQKQDNQDTVRKGNVTSRGVASGDDLPVGEADPAQKTHGKEFFVIQPSEDSFSKSAATPKDIEAFGQSLKSNNNLMPATNSTQMDHADSHFKRSRGSDNDPEMAVKNDQMLSGGLNCLVRNASSDALVSSGDAKMLSFSPDPSDDRAKNTSSQLSHGNVAAQDMVYFGSSYSQKLIDSNNTDRVEKPPSSQMAPFLFDQYETLKNGQSLAMHDAHRTQSVTTVEPWLTTASAINDQLSSPRSLALGVITPVASERPKKRRSVTGDLFPWQKEVELGCQRLWTMSSAEAEWAEASNRLIEKAEDETEINEDVSPVNRPKRRLILTTQLMQQVLRPPPVAILSLNASLNYETTAYFVARLALGDACSLICCSESDSRIDNGSLPAEELLTAGRIHDRYLSNFAQDSVSRARNLENDLSRWDKQVSLLDLRLECQDLERFCVINRFAKFHGRGQADGAKTSSSSGTGGTAQRIFPQRYVTARPVPRNLPDGIQCLSL
ncbi:hypothetical protein Nepgr_023393 [Nepenthes gracilis]|uniref:Uncharacterized protein n=1 Tax=Nepenthes gracilis TaxID=150966 RepID=A0AAD3T2S5_NEPGR|nr:hypothetical protein Nepgr_023393 [Nepenthes gracilis]